MKFYILVIFTFLLFSFSDSFSQSSDSNSDSQAFFVVDSIKISGNDITEEFIIMRELTFGIGDTVDQHTLDYNKERIFSLAIFNKVELETANEGSRNILYINVEESWYIFPVPFIQLKDKDWSKLSYGIYVLIKNFRGRNERLSGSAAIGYDPTITLSYYKPNIIRGSNVFFNIDLFYSNVKNRSIQAANLYGDDFDYTDISANVGLGNRFGNFHRAGIDLGFNYVESPKYFKGITASEERIDRLLKIGLEYTYDTRDLIQFPKEGILFSFYVQLKGLGINGINYQTYNIDFREYRHLFGNLNAKWRIATRHTSGEFVPFYDYSFLGFEEAVRGHYKDDREGHHYYLGSVELFHPIVKDVNITLDFIPLLPRELLTYRLALYAQIFGDTGTTQLRGDPLRIKDFDTGYGVGFSLLFLPYNVARFEVAFNENSNIEYIFDLGVSF